jgi:hypothetical protein
MMAYWTIPIAQLLLESVPVIELGSFLAVPAALHLYFA